MNLIESIKEIAKKNLKTIVLPETSDDRVLYAAEKILKEKIANIILLGDEKKLLKKAKELSIELLGNVSYIDPKNFKDIEEFIKELCEIRKHKKMTYEEAKNIMLNDDKFFACMLVRKNKADGVVAGSNSPTANVLKAGLQIIKTLNGVKTVSSSFIMETNSVYGENGILLFADCAVVPQPSSEQLADIAISTAKTSRDILNIEPKIAMLSFSTNGSAKHPLVDNVVKACSILKEKNVDFVFDGELQTDAAIVDIVAAKKAPKSNVAGKANVLVFPDLQSGNIGYKLVERFANAKAFGPILQGLNKPINDLSRGCSVEDIVNVVAITASQAK